MERLPQGCPASDRPQADLLLLLLLDRRPRQMCCCLGPMGAAVQERRAPVESQRVLLASIRPDREGRRVDGSVRALDAPKRSGGFHDLGSCAPIREAANWLVSVS